MTNADLMRMFEEKRPVCVMAQMAIERLLSAEELDRLFADNAEDQYERTLLFSSLARVMAAVVLCREATVNSAYKKMKEQVGVSLTALYEKLARVEPRLSRALVRHSYAQLKSVSNHLRTFDRSVIAGFTEKVLDGNHLAGTERRLKETRRSTAAPLPGKNLVVLDPRREAIADLFPIEDGHAQERSALDAVIETIEERDLWIADANFCTLKFLYEIERRGGRFVIRLHSQLHGEPLGPRRYCGKTETGRVYESRLQLPAYDGRTLIVRCIELELYESTRDGEQTLKILTNLSEEEASAMEVAEAYHGRWRIETAFQKLTTNLHCEVDTLCYPKAAIFAFSLACLAYNATSLMLAAIRAEHDKEKTAELSFHYLAQEIAQAHDGLQVMTPAGHWDAIRDLPLAEFAQRLREVARHIDFDLYRKAKRRPRKPKPKLLHQRSQVHVSTAKILQRRKQQNAC